MLLVTLGTKGLANQSWHLGEGGIPAMNSITALFETQIANLCQS